MSRRRRRCRRRAAFRPSSSTAASTPSRDPSHPRRGARRRRSCRGARRLRRGHPGRGRCDARPRAAGLRPRVYLARGSDGLQSGGPGSINAEIIARAGAVNVVDTGEGRNLVDVTPGEVAAWAPDVILTLSPQFAADATASPEWRDLPAVAGGRLLLAPGSPFGSIDSPPSVNRLLGLRWLMHRLYPDAARGDLGPRCRTSIGCSTASSSTMPRIAAWRATSVETAREAGAGVRLGCRCRARRVA